MAKRAGIKLSNAALSHIQVPRTRYDSPLLPDAAVQVNPCDAVAASDRLLCSCGYTQQVPSQTSVTLPVLQALPQIPEDFRMTVEGDDDSQQQQQRQPDRKASGAGNASDEQQPGSQQQSGASPGQADSAGTSNEGAGGQAEAAAGSSSDTDVAADDDTAGEDSAGDAGSAAHANATLPAAATGTASSNLSSSSDSNVSSGSSASDLEQIDEGGPDSDTDQAPQLNATEAATIDFDDVDADATHGSGFLARLSDSVTGALGSVFS